MVPPADGWGWSQPRLTVQEPSEAGLLVQGWGHQKPRDIGGNGLAEAVRHCGTGQSALHSLRRSVCSGPSSPAVKYPASPLLSRACALRELSQLTLEQQACHAICFSSAGPADNEAGEGGARLLSERGSHSLPSLTEAPAAQSTLQETWATPRGGGELPQSQALATLDKLNQRLLVLRATGSSLGPSPRPDRMAPHTWFAASARGTL